MKKLGTLVVIFSTIVQSSCSLVSPENDKQYMASSGQSFGFCLGPCFQTLSLDWGSQQAEFIIRHTEFENNSVGFREEVIPINFLQDIWNETLNEVKNIENFESYQMVYGCPDCVDGGAEWIEITDKEGTHRVTFEFGKTVKGLDNLILLLRNKRTALSKMHVSQ
ncbi:MAG: hypothetical protein ACI9DJ_002121 [Algoriphagus sp.]|jgi:hypothetical protein